jgi:hypothetical protein
MITHAKLKRIEFLPVNRLLTAVPVTKLIVTLTGTEDAASIKQKMCTEFSAALPGVNPDMVRAFLIHSEDWRAVVLAEGTAQGSASGVQVGFGMLLICLK